MAALVEVDEAKVRLRLDDGDEDLELEAMIEEASDIVVSFLKKDDHGWTPDTVPGQIKSAVLIVLGRLYAAREGEIEGGIINDTVRNLLWRDRDPALA